LASKFRIWMEFDQTPQAVPCSSWHSLQWQAGTATCILVPNSTITLLLKMHPKTQLNRRKLDKQTGKRVVDRLIIQCAYDRVRPPDLPPACAQQQAPAMLLPKQCSCFGRCQMTGPLMPTVNLCGKVRNTNTLGYCYMKILCFFWVVS
jgi:hypothetical protein